MADPKIKIRRSATPNKVPTKDQLQLGELAINTYDGKLYLEQDQGGAGVGNTVIAVNPWNVGVGSTAYNTHFTSGKVGVGTTNAQYNLDIGGNVNFTGNLYQDGSLYTSGTTGVGIKTAGGIVGYAATIIDFRGPGVTTAHYSSVTGIATVNFHSVTSGGGGGNASVTVSDSAPSSPSNGDLWFKSDVGELYLWYADGSSNQWVEASGGSNTVVTSDSAPTSPQDGDLWWNSDTGELKVYYNDGNSSQWVDANSEGGFVQYWTQTNTNGTLGVTTTGYVGIGTTTATDALTVSGNANVTGFLTATQLNGAVSSTGVNVSGVATALNLISPVTSSGVNVTGVATALHLKGPLTSSGINVTGVSTFSNTVDINSNLDVSGNATIGGVLTYEDVRNVDSIGIVTARTGIKVLAGGANIVDGTTTDELNVTGVATAVQLNATTLNVTGVSTFQNNILLGDDDRVIFGDGGLSDAHVRYDGSNLQFGVASGEFRVSANGARFVNYAGTETLAVFNNNGANQFYYDNSKKLETSNTGISVTGDIVGSGSTAYSTGLIVGKQGAEFQGVVTASSFSGSGANLTDVISGVGIGTEGGVVGYAATILHFRGAGVTTAYYSATTGVGTVFFHSTAGGGGGNTNVTIQDAPPSSPSTGDLWWESDTGELKIYYNDGNSSQWVDTSGTDDAVFVSTTAPSNPVAADLWFNSQTGDLMIYYTDANTSQWVSVNATNSERIWNTNSTGIHTSRSVGIGTTTVTDALTVVGATDLDGRLIVSGITTFGSHVYHGDNDHAIFGDGSDLSIYHDSSNSWIKNTTGNLTLNSNTIHLKDGGNNKNYLRTYVNDRVELYFNNGEKFRTTNTGVSVTGDIVGSGSTAYSTGLIVGKQGAEFQGVVTATTFVGALTGNASGNAATATLATNAQGLTGTPAITVGALTATTGQFSGDVNVLGTLTYEDVKNVDSAGIATARQGLRITGGGLDVVGVSTFNDNVKLLDNDQLQIGTGGDLKAYHDGSNSYLSHTTGALRIIGSPFQVKNAANNAIGIEFTEGNSVDLYYNGSKKFETTSSGAQFTGTDFGFNATPGGTPASKAVFLAIGDSDTGIVQDGDGQLEIWGNAVEVANFNAIDGYTSTKPITTTGAVQTGDLTILNGNPDLRLKDSNHGGNNTEHMIAFQDSSGNNQMNIGSPFGEQHLRIKYGTTDLVKIQTDGKIGINNTSPNRTVNITSATGGNCDVELKAANNTGWCQLIFSDTDAAFRGGIGYEHQNNYMAFYTGAQSEALRITSDGKIGVGIASPVGTFEIRDSKANLIVAKDGLTAISNSDAHTTYDLIQLGAGGGLASYSTATATADTHLVHNAYRHSGGSWKYKYADTAMRLRMNSPGGAFIFDSAASGSAGATISFSEKLRITSDGYVGINNNSPATVLDIKSTKASDGLTVTKGSNVAAFLGHNGTGDEGLLHLKDGGTVTTQIYGETGQASFFNAGNVGFGSVTPASDVDVCGSAPEIRITNTATSRAYLSWYNHYGGVNKNANISYNEGSANWEFKLYRADSQANSPYGNIQFFTGSTSSPTLAMNITRPGSVTMPKQPCCVMTATSATTWSSGWTKIPVNSSYFDVGNNFDSGNNRYSIPVSGKYAIGFNVEMNIGNGQTWIYFVPRINRNDTTSKNAGINYADFAPMSNNSSNHYYCHNGHWIANLTQGDTVTFEMHGAGNAWTVAANNQSHYYIYQVA